MKSLFDTKGFSNEEYIEGQTWGLEKNDCEQSNIIATSLGSNFMFNFYLILSFYPLPTIGPFRSKHRGLARFGSEMYDTRTMIYKERGLDNSELDKTLYTLAPNV